MNERPKNPLDPLPIIEGEYFSGIVQTGDHMFIVSREGQRMSLCKRTNEDSTIIDQVQFDVEDADEIVKAILTVLTAGPVKGGN